MPGIEAPSAGSDGSPRVPIAEALQAKIGTLSLEAQQKLEKDTAKKEAKASAKADAALKKKMVRSSRRGVLFFEDSEWCTAGITSVLLQRYEVLVGC